MVRALLIALLLTGTAAAQPAKGDAIIDRMSLGALRPLAPTLAALSLGDPVAPVDYDRIIELRAQTPELTRLGALDDTELALVATALCRSDDASCTGPTLRALQCLAERCVVALPLPAKPLDLAVIPERCKQPPTVRRSSRIGLGFDWGNGWQRSAHPIDGRTTTIGIATRVRIAGRFGLVARGDWSTGRDAATDADDNGTDDDATRAVVRVAGLAGPSVVLHYAPVGNTTRFLRLDLLGGYLATRSQPDEAGPVAGTDLVYSIAGVTLGARFLQGFDGARDSTMAIAHMGVTIGSGPQFTDGATGPDCTGGPDRRSTRLAIGADVPLTGWGLSSQLGYLATGLGVEAAWILLPSLDALVRADLMLYPRYKKERVIHQAVLAGVRIDHGERGRRSSARTGWFTTVMAGYAHGAMITPTTAGSGPIVDLSVGWGMTAKDGAANLRLHGRSGITRDNIDHRALFLSFGFEFRLDSRRWKARI